MRRATRTSVVPGALALALVVGVQGLAQATPAPSPATSSASTPGPGTAGASPTEEPVLTTEGVEVPTHGVVHFREYQDQVDTATVVMAVHGVQRVEGGAVVYLSLGYEGVEEPPSSVGLSELVGTQVGGRYSGGGGLTSVRVVDRAAGEVLSTVREPGEGVLTGALATEIEALPEEPGVMYAAYAVVPELAAGTEVVDVTVGLSRTVVDVPVGEGLWEPGAPADEPVVLGEGWPQVDLDAVAAAPEPELSRDPLTAVSQSLGGETTTLEAPESVTVDVAADVLFAVDSAELSPQAQGVLDDVAARVGAEATGTVRVVGHTDSDAGEEYNQDLSERRAQAVAGVLSPVVTGEGLELVVEGRGESEPVADNGSEEGRAANRRVSVTFATAGAAQGESR